MHNILENIHFSMINNSFILFQPLLIIEIQNFSRKYISIIAFRYSRYTLDAFELNLIFFSSKK